MENPFSLSASNSEIIDLMHINRICVGKTAASTTEMTQSCNAGAILEGPKAMNNKISDADVITNIVMMEQLKMFLKIMTLRLLMRLLQICCKSRRNYYSNN